MKDKYLKFNRLLSNRSLIYGFCPSVAEIVRKVKGKKEVKLVYGETYDKYGLTIDSLKYYFFVGLLQKALESEGIAAITEVLIGDLHSVKNDLVVDKEALLKQAEERVRLVTKIKDVYGLNFNVSLMSKILEGEEFRGKLNRAKQVFDGSEKLRSLAYETVLTNRISQEEKKGFEYALEEAVLIGKYDLKIGPPREIYFDKLSRGLGSKLCGIYLKPTYPLGVGAELYIENPEIEKFGVTPYKAGSNKLQDNRIILGVMSFEEMKNLIEKTFVFKDPKLPNPILDLFIISEMAMVFLGKEKLEPGNIKEKTLENLKKFIFEPLDLR